MLTSPSPTNFTTTSEMATTTSPSAPDTPMQPEQISPKMTDTATYRAVNTPELLEQILAQCSTAEVTRARQVSGFFRSLIDNSKALRRVMFLEPEPVRETITHYLTPDPRNGIPDRRFRHIYNIESGPLIVAKLHPAIGTAPSQSIFMHDAHDAEQWPTKEPDWHWQLGMWRSMTLTQPPCADVEVRCGKWTGSGCLCFHEFKDYPLKGNTLGALADTWKELHEGDPKLEFYSLRFVGFVDEASVTVKVARAKREQDAIDAAKVEAEKIEAERFEGEKFEESGGIIEQAGKTNEVGAITELEESEEVHE
jgi:hypothetical protein